MKKRGQVTLFVILGIVIVAVLLFFLVGRETIFMPISSESLNSEMDNIKKIMIECSYDESANSPNELIKTLGMQGGYLETPEESYRLFDDSKVSYLCYDIENKENCMNRMLTIKNMEDQLNENVGDFMDNCLEEVKSQGNLKTYNVLINGEPKYEFLIRPDEVVLNINWPITLKGKSKDISVSEDKFEIDFNYPLGNLYDVSQDIINGYSLSPGEATTGYFDSLTYMLSKKGEYKIYVKKPYPDEVYRLVKEGNNYIFQFAVQGEDRFA
ncbi:MAG: hypothetical protein PHE43_02950 [Candidatus Nanoarchaeia archaeon]|nr:hypothetical protein [Candidatus Nanoarchaeia archaeon]